MMMIGLTFELGVLFGAFAGSAVADGAGGKGTTFAVDAN